MAGMPSLPVAYAAQGVTDLPQSRHAITQATDFVPTTEPRRRPRMARTTLGIPLDRSASPRDAPRCLSPQDASVAGCLPGPRALLSTTPARLAKAPARGRNRRRPPSKAPKTGSDRLSAPSRADHGWSRSIAPAFDATTSRTRPARAAIEGHLASVRTPTDTFARPHNRSRPPHVRPPSHTNRSRPRPLTLTSRRRVVFSSPRSRVVVRARERPPTC